MQADAEADPPENRQQPEQGPCSTQVRDRIDAGAPAFLVSLLPEGFMRVAEIMTAAVHTIGPFVPAEEAWQLMHARGVRHLIVTDESRVVGMLSEADLGGRFGEIVRRGAVVADLMDRHVVGVTSHDTIRKVANLMRGRLVGCLPVIEHERLVGVVTVADLLTVLGRGIDRPGQASRPATHFKVPHRRTTASTGRW